MASRTAFVMALTSSGERNKWRIDRLRRCFDDSERPCEVTLMTCVEGPLEEGCTGRTQSSTVKIITAEPRGQMPAAMKFKFKNVYFFGRVSGARASQFAPKLWRSLAQLYPTKSGPRSRVQLLL